MFLRCRDRERVQGGARSIDLACIASHSLSCADRCMSARHLLKKYLSHNSETLALDSDHLTPASGVHLNDQI